MTDREKLIELTNDVLKLLPWGQISTHTAGEIADHLIANGVTLPDTNVGKWIPVTERLPEKWQDVLTASKNGDVDLDYVCSSGAWFGDSEYTYNPVTHWMPLPSAPKEE